MNRQTIFIGAAITAVALIMVAWALTAGGSPADDSNGRQSDDIRNDDHQSNDVQNGNPPGGDLPGDTPDGYLGQYMVYRTSSLLSPNGTLRIEIIDEYEESGKTMLLYSITLKIPLLGVNNNYEYRLPADGGSITDVLGKFNYGDPTATDQKITNTINGKRYTNNTNVYPSTLFGQTSSVWVGTDDGMIYQIRTTTASTTLTWKLTETNIMM